MKTFRAILLASTTIISPTLAAADPVTAVALATTVGTAVASATISSAVIGALVATAIGVAGAFARSLLTPKSSKNQAEIRTGETDPHPAWRRAYGEFRQQGALVLKKILGEDLYCVWLLSDSKCHSIQKIWLNDIEMELLDNSENDLTDFSKGASTNTGPYWDDDVAEFWFADGTQTSWPSDFSFIETSIIDSTDLWVGNGQASALLFGKFTFGNSEKAAKRWPTGAPPRVETLARHSRLYDPRRDSTSGAQTVAQGDHRPDDDTTWQYIADDGTEIGANPALIALDAMRWERGLSIADERILIQQFADAADACEGTATVTSSGHTKAVTFDSSGDVVERTNSPDTGEPTDPDAGQMFFDPSWNAGGSLTVTGGNLEIRGSDADGTVTSDETVRFGAYFDIKALGLDPTRTYTLDSVATETSSPSTLERQVIATGDGIGTTPVADRLAYNMPANAGTITVVQDTGFVADSGLGPVSFSAPFVSHVGYKGAPNAAPEVWSDHTYTIAGATNALQLYRCDGLLKIETDEWSLLDPILDAMGGHLDTTAGKIGIRAGVWEAPTDTLSAPIGDGFEYVGRSDPGFAKVVPSYISRARKWEETDGEEYVLRSGDRTHNLSLAFVREPHQAAHLAQVFGERAKLNRTLTVTVSGREWGRRVGDRVTVSMSEFGRADGIYRIVGWEPITEPTENGAMRLYIRLTLQEDAAATYTFDSAGYSDPDFADPDPQVPVENAQVAISAEQSNYASGGTATPRLKITVTPTAQQVSNGGEIIIRTKPVGGTYQTLGSFATATTVVAYDPNVSVGGQYIAEAWHQSGSLGQGDPAESNTVTIVAATLDFDPADFNSEFA